MHIAFRFDLIRRDPFVIDTFMKDGGQISALVHSDANRGRVLLNRSMKFQFNLFSSAALSMKSEVLFKEGIKDLNDSKAPFQRGAKS